MSNVIPMYSDEYKQDVCIKVLYVGQRTSEEQILEDMKNGNWCNKSDTRLRIKIAVSLIKGDFGNCKKKIKEEHLEIMKELVSLGKKHKLTNLYRTLSKELNKL